jgi:hypothetical protein
MKDGKWQAALAGLRAVFEEFKGSPEVLVRLPAIEEDLKLCTFRAQEKPPAPDQIFGPGAKSFASTTRQLVMEFPAGPVSPPWEGTPPSRAILRIRFEDVAVDFEGDLLGGLTLDLSYDFDTDNGYELKPGFTSGKTRLRASIVRLEAGKSGGHKATIMETCFNDAGAGTHRVRFALKGGELSMLVDGRPLLSGRDPQFPRGFLGLRGQNGGSVTIRGTVDAAQLPSLLEACSRRRFQEWTEKSWRREDAIPEWARQKAK